MKNYQSVLFLFLFFCSLSAFGQLTVGSGGNIGLGFAPVTGSKFYSSKPIDIRRNLDLSSSFNTANGYNNSSIYNSTTTATNGVHILGITNTASNSGTGDLDGLRNEILAGGSGSKVGFRNTVSDDHPSGSSSAKWMFGMATYLTHKHYPRAWGNYIRVYSENPTSTDEIFGQQIYATGSGQAHTVGLEVIVPYKTNYYAAKFSGEVTMGTAATITSDERLKENIRDVENAINIINQLQPKTYRMKAGNRFNHDNRIEHFGFLAQEVEEILPSAVKDVRYATVYRPGYFPGVPEPGEDEAPTDDGVLFPAETFKGVKYTDFIPIIVQAVKEQQTEIETLNTALDNPLRKSNTVGFSNENITELVRENKQLKANLAELGSVVNELKAKIANIENCTDCSSNRAPLEIETDKETIAIYPNPAKAQVTINSKEAGAYQVKVLTADGRLWLSERFESKVNTLNTTSWPSGTYVFEVSSEDGVVLSRTKVVVQK